MARRTKLSANWRTSRPNVQHPNAPMTERQAAALVNLCAKRGVPFDASLTRGEASERISRLGGV